MYVRAPQVCLIPAEAVDALGRDLQTVVTTWVLEIEPNPLEELCGLNHRAIPLAPRFILITL